MRSQEMELVRQTWIKVLTHEIQPGDLPLIATP